MEEANYLTQPQNRFAGNDRDKHPGVKRTKQSKAQEGPALSPEGYGSISFDGFSPFSIVVIDKAWPTIELSCAD